MATVVDPSKAPVEMIEDIEAAEEAGDTEQILAYLRFASSEDRRNEEGEDEEYVWTEVSEEALDAFYRLVKASKELGASAALSHLADVFAALGAWKEEEAIVEVALGCIVAVASRAGKDEGDGSNSDDRAGALSVGLVLDTMKEFADEPTIQEQACLAIEGLALWRDDWKAALGEAEGIQDELAAARGERITNERNKAYPLRAAKALGIELDEA
ncbi:unnamed protein product [Pseudo-nitzschia multistriata]|uniref:Uncharacterized protein n=1 Tax=Pseudo-nitzschia multistriata TaxID=183589 RepID=A0A448YYR4_9STRA|nr:unnamed protein product [Pseudo-nitzschia multistriata]